MKECVDCYIYIYIYYFVRLKFNLIIFAFILLIKLIFHGQFMLAFICVIMRGMLMKSCSSNSMLNISDGLVNLLLSKLDF